MCQNEKQKIPVRIGLLTGIEMKTPLSSEIFKEILTSFLKKIKGFAGKNEPGVYRDAPPRRKEKPPGTFRETDSTHSLFRVRI